MLSVSRLSLEDARILIEGAIEKAEDMGLPMCIAVADESGNLIAFERMDGGKAHSIAIAQDKAFVAGASRRATHSYNEACVPGSLAFGIHTSHQGRFSTVGGGLPVEVDGVFVGGIGVSGGKPDQDMEVAQAGLDAFFEDLD